MTAEKCGSFCQIGSVGLRGADGKLMPGIPLYVDESMVDKGAAEKIRSALTSILKAQMAAQKAKQVSA